MDVRLMDGEDIAQARRLWKEAFSDSDAFIDWYFKNKVLPGNSLAMFDGGLVSMLHLIPYRISVQGKPVDALMIAGAATKTERRGQGHMRTLLLEALSLMRRRGIPLTYLYPFSHPFYEHFGWTTYTYVQRLTVTQAERRRNVEVVITDDYHALETVYRRMMRGFDGYVVRGEREWRWRLEELFADGGKAAVLLKNEVPAAYMLYYTERGAGEAVETAYTDEEDIGALLSHLLGEGCKSVKYDVPAMTRGSKYGMVRVVDVKALSRMLGAETLLGDIPIADDFAPWNNSQGNDKTALDIGALARIVCRGVSSRDMSDRPEAARSLNEAFPERNTCIFEMF